MKNYVLITPACFLLLGACTTYPVQTTSNIDVDTPVTEEAVVSSDGETATSEQDVDDNRIICKRIRVTGSRFTKKRCMTWFSWKQEKGIGVEFLNNIRRKGIIKVDPTTE